MLSSLILIDKPQIDDIIKEEGVRPVTGISDGPRTLFYSKKRAVTFVFLFFFVLPKMTLHPRPPVSFCHMGFLPSHKGHADDDNVSDDGKERRLFVEENEAPEGRENDLRVVEDREFFRGGEFICGGD